MFARLFPDVKLDKRSLTKDALASVVVFLVALPLCMGIAIASGVPAERGLVAGMVGGLIVGVLCGSPLQVSGPAAGLYVICFQVVDEYKLTPATGFQALAMVVLIGGALQLIAGALKTGRWFRAVTPAVIYGMLAGIGVLIFASQFHVMVDDDPLKSGLKNLVTIPGAIIKGLRLDDMLGQESAQNSWFQNLLVEVKGLVINTAASDKAARNHHLAAYIGILTIATIVLWNRFKPRVLKAVPGPLIAVVLGTLCAYLFAMDVQPVEVPASLASAVELPSASSLDLLADPKIWVLGFTVGLVASVETLLCASAVDKLHTGPRTDYDRELFAQGVGNITCGLLGALPVTGVIVRSSANVDAGGVSRLSAIFHGLLLVGFVAALPWLLNMVPRSCLAGILVYTGYRLVNVQNIKKLWTHSKLEAGIYFATLIGIVCIDLLTGILIGFALTILKLGYAMSHLELELKRDPDNEKVWRLELIGSATFMRLPSLAAEVENVPFDATLHVELDRLSYIDHACLDLLHGWEAQAKQSGGDLILEWHALEERTGRPRLPARQPPSEGEEAAVTSEAGAAKNP